MASMHCCGFNSVHAYLQLFELGEVCAAPNLTQAEQSQPAGNLILAFDSAQQGLDSVRCLIGARSGAQHSNTLCNVVLGGLANLLVMPSSQQC